MASSGLSGVTSSVRRIGQARVGEHVDEVVVALHFGVRHAAGEHDLVLDAERGRARLQRRFLRPAADEQHAQRRMSRHEDRGSAASSRSSPS